MEQTTKLFLLDAYALIYRAYYAFIRNPRVNSKGLNTSAILGFVNTLEEVLNKEQPTHIGIAFDPAGPTFRHKAFEDYKAQREATPEDIKLAVPIIKEIIKAYHIPILEVAGYEADDVIGTLAKQAHEQGITTYMMTPDKDYAQLVDTNIFMYRPKYGDRDFEVLGPKEIIEKYEIEHQSQIIDLLGLMGDASDNIPGCPGVGIKTAQKLIAEFGSIENLIENTDKLKGAIKKKVEENIEQIKFSKFLATIKVDVPIELKLENLKRETIDKVKIRSLFEELEFRALAERILKETEAPTLSAKSGPIQGNLFDENPHFPTVSSKETKNTAVESINKTYELVDNLIDIAKLVKKLSSYKEIALDTETTGIEAMEAEIVGISFSVKKHEAFYVPFPEDKEETQKRLELLRPILENKDSLKIGQNIKYDLLILKNYNINVGGPLFDTMIAHYVVQPELRHNMDYLAEIYLGHTTIPIEDLIGPKGKNQKSMRDLDPKDIYIYGCEDADITLQLKEKLEEDLKNNNADELFYTIEMPLVPVLVDMEFDGVLIDKVALKALSTEFSGRMNIIEEEVKKLAGEDFNVSSPKQVGEILFDKLKIDEKAKKTKTGQYTTSEEVLQNYKDKHPIVGKILDYRGLKKLVSTYVDALPKLINKKTGKLHTSFNQTITATGRLSSSNPNLQNIPIRNTDGKEIRKAFIPDPDSLFFSADYSQIELRIMAHLSKDPNMLDGFRHGDDIHASTAAKIYKEKLEDVTSDQRRKAKTANFGIIYGISVFGLAERMQVDRKEAKDLIDGYFATYPEVKTYMDSCIEVAKEKGYVETISNRKRFLPDINSKNGVVRGFSERNAINAPIQGSAADIIKIAMINIHKRFIDEGIKSKMILQVHDELNFSVILSEKEKVQQIVIEEMERAYPLSIPLKADYGWGSNWLEAH
jgi:DNA polymerase I